MMSLKRIVLLSLVAVAGAAALWAVFWRGPALTPLNPEQIRAEVASLAAVTVEHTSSPVLVLEEPARVLGFAVPFTGNALQVPIRGAVRAGFRPEALLKSTWEIDGRKLQVLLPPAELLTVRAELEGPIAGTENETPEGKARLNTLAETLVRNEALEAGVVTEAEADALRQLTRRFQRFGYEASGRFFRTSSKN